MPRPDQVKKLEEEVGKLLGKALAKIRRGRTKAPQAMERRFRAAEYLLTEARQYVDGAWDLLKTGKEKASLAVSRWLLEAALNLLWVTVDRSEVDKRLKLLSAEALRMGKLLFKGLADLSPTDSETFRDWADALRQERVALVGKDERGLAPLLERLRDAIGSGEVISPEQLYALYRICCAYAHPSLGLWRRFEYGPGGATVTSAPQDSAELATLMVAVSSFHLVSGSYTLTGFRKTDYLMMWLEQHMAPLFGSA